MGTSVAWLIIGNLQSRLCLHDVELHDGSQVLACPMMDNRQTTNAYRLKQVLPNLGTHKVLVEYPVQLQKVLLSPFRFTRQACRCSSHGSLLNRPSCKPAQPAKIVMQKPKVKVPP